MYIVLSCDLIAEDGALDLDNLFAGFYKPAANSLKELWSGGTIVIDANILLSLYRYPAAAREEMLGVLEKVAPRLWVPYHAVLEYQRNRASVVKEQKGRFRDVRKIIEAVKTDLRVELEKLNLPERHSLIDPNPLIQSVGEAILEFEGRLETLEKTQIDVHEHDILRDRIDVLLQGRVGAAPSQPELDGWKAEAAKRMEYDIPPGNADAGKEHGKSPRYSYAGLRYEASLGDLYLWKQLLAFASDTKPSGVLLVTDDRKPDWWHVIDSGGKKTLGPRPELIDEMAREAGVTHFWMYKADQFVRHAREELSANISDESIEQIKATSTSLKTKDDFDRDDFSAAAISGVERWIRDSTYDEVTETPFGLSDFVVTSSTGDRYAYEVVLSTKSFTATIENLRRQVARAFSAKAKDMFEGYTVVVVMRGSRGCERVVSRMRELRLQFPVDVDIVVGYLSSEFLDTPKFIEISRVEDLRV